MAKIKVTFEQLVELRHRSDVTIYIEQNTLEAHIKDVSLKTVDPVKLLPDGLRKALRHRAAFRRAFECGFITYKAGHFGHTFTTAYKLAYFLGRCFSDDRIVGRSKKEYVCGDNFPAAELDRLFDVKNLKESREGVMKLKNFRCYKFIDSLFVSRYQRQ